MKLKITPQHKTFLNNYDSPVWNLCSYCLFNKKYSFNDLELAMNKVVEKNEVLRMNIEDECISFFDYKYRHFERLLFTDECSFTEWAKKKANEPVIKYPGMWNAYLIDLNGKVGIFNIGHHIMCDALNVSNLYQKICDEFDEKGEKDSYSTHLIEYNNYLSSNLYKKDELYWKNILSKLSYVSFFSNSIDECNNISIQLNKISDFCLKYRINESSFVYATVAVFFMYISGQDVVSLGIPIIGRTTQNEMRSLGLFMHDVPMIIDGVGKNFIDFTREIENNLFDLFRHQRYNLSDMHLFDVSVDYSEYPKMNDYEANVVYNNYLSTALEFHFLKRDGLNLTIRAQKGFCKSIESLLNGFVKLFHFLLKNPYTNMLNISLVEQAQFGSRTLVPNCGLYSLIENNYFGKIIDGNIEYSLQELKQFAEKVDYRIRGKKRIIGIICDRSFAELVAIYGVIRGGNAYLPILPEYPKERINLLLKESNCDTILVQKKYADYIENPIIIEEVMKEDYPINHLTPAAEAEDPLYVMFTSGSTGVPKGVVISNRSIINRILWMNKKYFSHDSVVMLKTPFTFDVSVWEIFAFAIGGFTLYILPFEDHYKQDKVIEHIRKGNVTDLHFVPTIFSKFLDRLKIDGVALPTLKNIFLSGEKLNANLVNESPVRVHNLYGPTECAVDVTSYDCLKTENDPIPIGNPIDNCDIYILNKRMQLLPNGLIGQIGIGGIPVGIGYINDDKKTQESFIDNPFTKGKLYLTGDLGYQKENGEIVFIGRNDRQIKINGQRIEIGEIESVLNKLVNIGAVIVKDGRIIAFYSGNEQKDLRKELIKLLPIYLVPHHIVHVDEMPLTLSGKIDYSSLNLLFKRNNEIIIPKTEEEKKLVLVVEEVLNITNISIDDNFYELGGDSLSSLYVINTLKESGYSISVYDFLRSNTLEDIAKKMICINPNVIINKESSLECLYHSIHEKVAYVLFPFAGGNASSYTALVQEFKRRNSDVSLYYVPWGCNYEKVSKELKSFSVPLRFYSHCVGSVIALKLLDVLDNVEIYFAGASIPPENSYNIWNNVSDDVLITILYKAGMPLMSDIQEKEMVKQFRNNVDEYFDYLNKKEKKTPTDVYLVLSKYDIFTQSYLEADKLWSRYVKKVSNIYFIDSKSHYFQSINASILADILLGVE